MAKALVIYFSKTGHTKKMAEAVAEGISSANLDVTIEDATKASVDALLDADAIVLGSPTYYGTMAGEMKVFLDKSVKHHGKLHGKIGGAFCSSGILGGGNETTVMSLIEALLIHGMIVQGHPKMAHYGPVAVGAPDGKAIEECVKYGKQVGELTLRLKG